MYSPEMNSIWLPLGIQSLPVFEHSRLKSLNLGSWGAIVGHELTHGFDNSGAMFDADGNFKVKTSFNQIRVTLFVIYATISELVVRTDFSKIYQQK